MVIEVAIVTVLMAIKKKKKIAVPKFAAGQGNRCQS